MVSKVLSVGQCRPDQSALDRLLKSHFDVGIQTAATASDALELMSRETFALVLINRKLDADYTDGLEIIKAMKRDAGLAEMPVMLITNYEEYQTEAVACGAVRGFGKLTLSDPGTVDMLSVYLKSE